MLPFTSTTILAMVDVSSASSFRRSFRTCVLFISWFPIWAIANKRSRILTWGTLLKIRDLRSNGAKRLLWVSNNSARPRKRYPFSLSAKWKRARMRACVSELKYMMVLRLISKSSFEIGAKDMAAIEWLEVFAAQVAVYGLQLFAAIARLAGDIEGLFIHIRRIDLDSAAKCLNPAGLGKHHRGGIGLLARSTAGAPYPDGISRRFLLKQPGDDLLAQVTPRHGIAKERCDIDQDRIE